MFLKTLFPKICIIFILTILLNGCNSSFFKPDWSKPAEPDGKKRARQNVEEGKGLQLFKKDNSGGNFLFASSNPLWRASLGAIDFMTLSSVDYAGGIIITDWYSDGNQNESIKITIRFLSNEVRSDALDVKINKKLCSSVENCSVTEIKNDLNFKIKNKILKQAAIYQKELDENKKNNTQRKSAVTGNENRPN
jgi:hypothetical protein